MQVESGTVNSKLFHFLLARQAYEKYDSGLENFPYGSKADVV